MNGRDPICSDGQDGKEATSHQMAVESKSRAI